jgi:hypothetical protein
MTTIKKNQHIEDVLNEDTKVQEYILSLVKKIRDAEEGVVEM